MNKRQIALLKKLIIQDSYLPIKYFSKELNTSGKTLSKDLDEIEEELKPIGVQIDRKQGIGIRLHYTHDQLDRINSLLNSIKVSDGDRDLEHRRIEILLNILMNTNEYTTVQKLSDEYIVSRTSINNDLNEIEQRLEEYNLKLSRTLKGTKIVGSEIDIRKALVSIIQEYGEIVPNYIVKYQSIRHKELNTIEINTILDEESVLFFENLLNKFENQLKVVIYEPYYTNLLTHLAIMTNRIINGNFIKSKLDLDDVVLVIKKELYKSTIYLINEIEKKFNIEINLEERVYIYKYLTSIGLRSSRKNKVSKELNLAHIDFTKDLIDIVSQMLNMNFNSNSFLYERLNLHIKPMLNRTKYNIQIKNPLLKDFLEEFERDFIIVKVACFLVCQKFEINMISDHEVVYILSYFISENEKNVEAVKVKTLVACHSGYGTSQILATRLERSFNNIEILDTISSSSINNYDLDKIDLIVSTVDLNIKEPYFIVSAFLNEIDKKNIENYIDNIAKGKGKAFSKEDIKIDLVKNSASINKDDLIHLKDNTYIHLIRDKDNLIMEYKTKKEEKNIFLINYSNYEYLSKALRQIMNKGKGREI